MERILKTDVLVYGGTAPALVAAVRCAREGLAVALVTPTRHLGGSLPSLGAVETHYRGVRAPLLQEFIDAVTRHYRDTYGPDSEQAKTSRSGMMLTFEPHVAERILRRWVETEPRIEWIAGFSPDQVARAGRCVQSVRFAGDDGRTLRVTANAVVEGSYEGDLMAAAGAEYRVGREARSEFGEPRAGKVFTRWVDGVFPRAAAQGRLNLVTANATTSEPLPGSTGEGDGNIQSFSYRLCLTDDPANRAMLTEPPPGYDRARYAPILLSPAEKERLALPFHHRFLIYPLTEMAARDHIFHGHALPNRKRSWNATNLPGGGKRYPTASLAERREIEAEHRRHALGLMWFLQNDSAMPPELRAQAAAWGFARDEFAATGHFPPQLYIREARRLAGRAIMTEHDALPAPGQTRAPVQRDAVAIVEFSMDSLACTTERLPGADALCDGQLFQMEVSRPGQVPFGALLPRELDNLLVVTTVSATHVAWGTVRQTPTLMHLAESAAWAVVLAARGGVTPAGVDVSDLQRQLVTHGIMISFFNEFDMACRESWVPAVQLLGARGFFPTYDAAPSARLDEATAHAWSRKPPHVDSSSLRGRTFAEAAEIIYRALPRCAAGGVAPAAALQSGGTDGGSSAVQYG